MVLQNVQPADVALATGGLHVLAEIGEGGFGKVYRAMVNNRPVAIKVMAADGLQGQAEFDNEQRLLSKLSHAHLVRLLGVCRSSNPPLRCLLYELMPGGNVEEHLASEGSRQVLPWWLRLRVAAQVAAAIAYLHGLPAAIGGALVHRDIKPANWFLDGRLNAKLGDVGLATPVSDAAAASRNRAAGGEQDMVGTYAYLPPEYRSSGVVSLKTDVFAFGVSLLQLATGQLERLTDLVPSCREAVAAGQGSCLLDAKAGTWDAAAGERLLCLGLWCCTESPDSRPSSAVVAEQLAGLWLATDQALKASAGSAVPVSRQHIVASNSNDASGTAIRVLPPQQSPATGIAGAGVQAGGNFWKFLTGAQ